MSSPVQNANSEFQHSNNSRKVCPVKPAARHVSHDPNGTPIRTVTPNKRFDKKGGIVSPIVQCDSQSQEQEIQGLRQRHDPRAYSRKGGSFDQKGLIMDLLKNGFTIFTSFCELIANSFDADGEKIGFINDPHGKISGKPAIYLIDNGSGMSIEDFEKKFFCLFAQNHFGQKTSGISGKGAKAALLTLGKKKGVVVYSKKGDCFSKAEIPYDKILDRNDDTLWEGGITFTQMSDSEIEMFNTAKTIHQIQSEDNGTLIEIPWSKSINDELDKQFMIEQRKFLFPEHRFDFVFGKQYDEKNFALVDFSEGETKYTIQPYQYFEGHDHLYYKNLFKNRIDVYKNKASEQVRYIWKKSDEDKSEWFEILPFGRGWRRELEKAKTLNGYKKIGELTLCNAMRKDTALFDENNPSFDMKLKTHAQFGDYNSLFIDYSNNIGIFSEKMADAALVRNNQRIGQFPIVNFKGSSARGNKIDITGGFAKICLFQSELIYSVTCSQDNLLDNELGIQSNKNQINYGGFPEPLMRLLNQIKSDNWVELSNYFKTKVSQHKEKVREAKRLQEEAEKSRLAAEAAQKALENPQETTGIEAEAEEDHSIPTFSPVHSPEVDDAQSEQEDHDENEDRSTPSPAPLGTKIQNCDDENDSESSEDEAESKFDAIGPYLKLTDELEKAGRTTEEFSKRMKEHLMLFNA